MIYRDIGRGDDVSEISISMHKFPIYDKFIYLIVVDSFGDIISEFLKDIENREDWNTAKIKAVKKSCTLSNVKLSESEVEDWIRKNPDRFLIWRTFEDLEKNQDIKALILQNKRDQSIDDLLE